MKKMFLYSIGNFPAGLLLLMIQTWAMRLYSPSPDESSRISYVSPETYGMIFFLISIPSALADPLVGFLSDRCKSRMGRRIPFLMWGLFPLSTSFFLLWFPPLEYQSEANAIWLCIFLLGVYCSFTVVVNPYLALMPEIWREERDRVKVSVFMSGVGAFAQIFTFLGVGTIVTEFEHGVLTLGIEIQDGFKVSAILASIITILSLLPTILWVKETPYSAQKDVQYGFIQSSIKTLSNKAFLPYILSGSLLGSAQFLVIETVPFIVRVIIREDEAVAGYILLLLVIISGLLLPVVNILSKRFIKERLYMASLISFGLILPCLYFIDFFENKILFLVVICVLLSPSLAISLVVPRTILADVMDFDAKLTGFRREAMYNGMEGLIQKLSAGIAPLIQGLLFVTFGYTSAQPDGILFSGIAGGIIALMAAIAFSFYPLGSKR